MNYNSPIKPIKYISPLEAQKSMTYTSNKQTIDAKDIFSVLLFALYRLTKDESYGIVSQMACVLDRQNLIKLCG